MSSLDRRADARRRKSNPETSGRRPGARLGEPDGWRLRGDVGDASQPEGRRRGCQDCGAREEEPGFCGTAKQGIPAHRSLAESSWASSAKRDPGPASGAFGSASDATLLPDQLPRLPDEFRELQGQVRELRASGPRSFPKGQSPASPHPSDYTSEKRSSSEDEFRVLQSQLRENQGRRKPPDKLRELESQLWES